MTLDLPAIVARETAVRDAAADALRSRRRDAAEAVALMAEERRALDALALVAEVERLRAAATTDPAAEQRQRLCGDRGCTKPAYRCDGCGAEGCEHGLRKACRCEGGPDASPLYDDAPAGDECAAFSDVPLDTPMPPAFVEALARLSPAQPGALDLDALHARVALPTCSQCGAVDPPTEDAEGLDGHRFARHVDCPTPHPLFASEVGDHGLTRVEQRALVARVRELEAQLAAAQPAVARDALRNGRFTAHCCVCSAEWPLGARDCPGCGHPDRDAGAVPAVSQPAPLDFHGALAAVRNGRFVPTWVRCLACGGTRADVDGAPCEPCRGTGLQPPPSDTDLCPRCGAFDLDHDHACAKSAATVAGEAFATEHPYAAAGIMGSATAREGKG